MGWSLDGRRLVTANSEGSINTWSGLDFSHMGRVETDQGSAILSLAWLRDGAR